jgi:hypothetical protein
MSGKFGKADQDRSAIPPVVDLSLLIARYFDGLATENESAQLRAALLTDPAGRDLFALMSITTVLLDESRTSPYLPITPSPHPSSPSPSPSPVLGFLGNLTQLGRSLSLALFTLLFLISATAITIAVVLIVTICGIRLHVDGPGVAGRNGNGEVGRAGDGEMGRDLSPHLPIAPSRHPSSLSTVARLINTSEARWAIGSHSPRLGDDLEPGRELVLLSGLAEVMFESGVRALLQGPATMEIGSQKSACLRQGKLTVTVVDPDGHGFAVYTPGMKYTDLGTEFGVSVAKDGTQEVLVFRGKVQAEARGPESADGGMGRLGDGEKEKTAANSISPSPHLPISPSPHPPISPSSLVLAAHEAIRVAGPDKPIERIAANEKLFVRSQLPPEPFPLFSTGADLDRGAADPHWELVAISTDPSFRPQQAVVMDQSGCNNAPDARDKAQWLSIGRNAKDMPDGCRWTFRTRFDLTGFDPATARIEGRFAADDFLVELRVNGTRMPLPSVAGLATQARSWTPLRIDWATCPQAKHPQAKHPQAETPQAETPQGVPCPCPWVAGINTVELVVENRLAPKDAPQDFHNVMAFCLEWKGTARKLNF